MHLSFITAPEVQGRQGSSFEKRFEMCVRPCTKTDEEPADRGCMLRDAGVRRTRGGPHSAKPCVYEGLPAVDRRCPKIRNALMNSGGLTKLFFAAAVMFSSCPC